MQRLLHSRQLTARRSLTSISSLANFMNAFTASDYTMYPFATTNQTDCENLQRVYCDAVFFPLLQELDFAQEGWCVAEPAR